MKKLSKNALWAFLILFSLMVVYSLIARQFEQAQGITLSELVEKINAGEIAEIAVIDSSLDIKLKSGERLKAEKELESGLSETLRNYGVEQEKLREVKIGIENGGVMRFFVYVILPFLGPVLLIGFFIWFTARQVQRGSMQAFTSANRARASFRRMTQRN